MILLNDFFFINDLHAESEEVKTNISFHSTHAIFKGHFPSQPVVPGVCMMQIIKEILEEVLHQHLYLIKANEMKFLSLIDPMQNDKITALLKYSPANNGQVDVIASLVKNEQACFKFKGQFDVHPHSPK